MEAPNGIDSAAYKRAHRNHIKSTRRRPPDEVFDWTPFRSAEKQYKSKFPPPSLDKVLDLALLDGQRSQEIFGGGWKGSSGAVPVRPVRMRDDVEHAKTDWSGGAFCVPEIPGLVLLPGHLSPQKQRELIRWSLRDHAHWPNETNLDTHYKLPAEGIWMAHARSKLGTTDPKQKELIQPRALSESGHNIANSPGPRQLISNTPADPSNFLDLRQDAKAPPAPSDTVRAATASELLPKLRWANIGWSYHWGSKQYDFQKGRVELGSLVGGLCKDIVRNIDWHDVFADEQQDTNGKESQWGTERPDWETWVSSYEPDAGIVNFYQFKDTLMGHADRSEICATSPLVSISLGNAAVFLIGGLSRDIEPIPILLRSGDALIMAGPGCRRAYHGRSDNHIASVCLIGNPTGVPRILEGSLPSHLKHCPDDADDWDLFHEYLRTTRININVRQVFPKDFDPVRAGETH